MQELHPDRVHWKTYSIDNSDDRPVIAFVTPSQKVLQADIITARNELVRQGFAVKIPCDGYGRERLETDSYLVSGGYWPVSPQEGAEHIISAMQWGYTIWPLDGGSGTESKLQLVAQYFRNNKSKVPKYKTRVMGFSNITPFQNFTELFDFVHGHVAATYGRGYSPSGLTHELTKEIRIAREETLAIMRGEEPELSPRILTPANPMATKMVEEAKDIGGDEDVRVYLYNLKAFHDSLGAPWQFSPPGDKKYILGLEGYIKEMPGGNAHEILRRGLQSGLLRAERILYIELDELVSNQAPGGGIAQCLYIDGCLAPYEEQTETAKKWITAKAAEHSTSCSDFIAGINDDIASEVKAVLAVAKEYDIPVFFGGKYRPGHGYRSEQRPQPINTANTITWEGGLQKRTTSVGGRKKTEPLRDECSCQKEDIGIVGTREFHSIPEVLRMSTIPINQSANALLDRPRTLEVRGGAASFVQTLPESREHGTILLGSGRDRRLIHELTHALYIGRLGANALSGDACNVPFVVLAIPEPEQGYTIDEVQVPRTQYIEFVNTLLTKLAEYHNISTPLLLVPELIGKIPDTALFHGKLEATLNLEAIVHKAQNARNEQYPTPQFIPRLENPDHAKETSAITPTYVHGIAQFILTPTASNNSLSVQ